MSDDREKLMRMLQEGQRAARSRRPVAPVNTPGSSEDPHASPLEVTADVIGAGRRRRRAGEGEGSAPSATHLNATDSLQEFLEHYYRVCCTFAEDSMRHELVLDRELTAYDRHVLHDLAQACGLNHVSRGEGEARTLVLQKDALFYGNPTQHERVRVDEICERIKGKTSKFDVRHVRTHALGYRDGSRRGSPPPVPGQVGSYADEDAVRKIQRFLRATDEYRHAQHMGYSQEEAEADGAGGHAARLEDLLRARDGDGEGGGLARAGAARALLSPPPSSTMAAAAASVVNQRSAPTAATTATTPVVYYEVCKSCHTRSRLEGDRGRWQCLHYCARCAKASIWVLEEDTGRAPPSHTRADGGAGQGVSSGGGVRRGRDGRPLRGAEAVEMYGSQGPLPLDVSGGEGEGEDAEDSGRALSIDRGDTAQASDVSDMGSEGGEEELTVDDVVDSAAINDFSDEDTNWIRAFAVRHRTSLRDHVIFCIEFSDLTCAPVFYRHDDGLPGGRARRVRRERPPCAYVVVRGVAASSAAGPTHVTTLIDKVVAAVSLGAEGSLAVAFKNLSVYGTEATAICQLRGCAAARAAEALVGLSKEYGSRHVFAAADLAAAVEHATAE